MAQFNKCIFIGNTGKDLDVKTFANSGDKVGRTSLAVTERYTKADGSKGEEVTWVNLEIPSHLVDNASKFLTKGRLIHVEGKLKIREYADEAGVKKQAVYIRVEDYQLLDKKPKEEEVAA